MSNYTKSTNFATKDNLTPGDPLKVVRGTEIDTEFNNISTAIATKTDNSAAAITGGTIDGATVGATTPATGAFTTLAASGTTTLAGALVGAATQSAFNTVSTTLNLGGAATALNLGAATGTATVNNTTLAAKAITASTTLAVTGTSTLTGAVTATAGVSGPITSSSVSITGGSITGITDLAVADGGTGASTAAGGLNNLLPSQTGNASKYLQTDGTNASWDAVSLSTADITGTLGAANGGTGVSNNAAMTVTGSGNFAYTRTLTGTTNVTFPTTGTLATLAGTETLTNKTINLTSNTLVATSAQILAAVTDETGTGALVFATSPTLVTPTLGVATGTSFQGIIGNVTPAAGSFTTLGASSTATLNTLASSGATLTGGTINGMTVGATTPSSGAFTTVTASTAIGTTSGGTGLSSFTSGGVVYASSTSALATGSGLLFDGSNLGVGVTPSEKLEIYGTTPIFQINDRGLYQAQFGLIGNDLEIRGSSGVIEFYTGADDGASSTLKATLNASGNLGLGVIPSAWGSGTSVIDLATGGSAGAVSSSGTLSIANNGFFNGTNWIYKNTNTALTYQQILGEHRWNIAASGTAGNTISFTQAMTLTAAGNLCIGTTSASVKLRVESADADYISVFRNTNASGYGLQVLTQGSGTNLAFQVRTNAANTDAFQVLDNGRVGIGTNAPDSLLHILTPSSHTVNVLIARTQNSTTYTSSVATIIGDRGTTDSTYNLLNCYNNGTGNQLVVRDSGNVQNTNNSYGAISDVKLKENIVDASPKLADLMQVKVRSYNLKSGSAHKQLGVIAQELETVFPAMVEEAIDRDTEGNDLGTTTKSVKYSVFVPMLIKAIQEQQAIIESLKARLDAANL